MTPEYRKYKLKYMRLYCKALYQEELGNEQKAQYLWNDLTEYIAKNNPKLKLKKNVKKNK